MAGLLKAVLGMRIMEFFARRTEPAGVTEVAKALGLPKARTHRYLATLRDLGYLMQEDPSDRYQAGWSLYILSQDVRHNFSLTRSARPMTRCLMPAGRHDRGAVHLHHQPIIVLDFVAPPSPLEMGLRPGSRFALHCGAQGKIALAYADSRSARKLHRRRHAVRDPALHRLRR